MRIIYIGAVDFSYHCLTEILKNKGDIVGIITSKNDHINSDFCDLTPISDDFNIPIHYCKNINDPVTIKWIKNKKPDIVFCLGWSQIIKKELLSLPKKGIVGVHPALLPKNRGRHPLIWSLVLGLRESGLTFFFMDEGTDSGPILSQERFIIQEEDTANDLYKKIKGLATKQIAEFLPNLIVDNYQAITQDSEQASYWRKRSKKDGVIDWRMSEVAILNLVRALTRPYPGAQFMYQDQMITVWSVYKYDRPVPSNMEPGRIIAVLQNRPVIKCMDGAILVDRFEPIVDFTIGEYST